MAPGAVRRNDSSTGSLLETSCRLRNPDGSKCRKRCLGDKRFRSMQEHIRRAHPEYYIPRLPATEESIERMCSSTPAPPPATHSNTLAMVSMSSPNPRAELMTQPFQQYAHPSYYTPDTDAVAIFNNMQEQQRRQDYRRGSLLPDASAAAVLAELHYHRPDNQWADHDLGQGTTFASMQLSPPSAETEHVQGFFQPRNGELRPTRFRPDASLQGGTYLRQSPFASTTPETPAMVAPTLPRPLSRLPATRSRRLKGKKDKRPLSEPNGNFMSQDKRWHELLDAATSATEEGGDESREPTPNPASSLNSPPASQSLLPPFQPFTASPLQHALTPPSPDVPLPYSVASPSPNHTASTSPHFGATNVGNSPIFGHEAIQPTPETINPDSMLPNAIQPLDSGGFSTDGPTIYCSGCRRGNPLKDSFACTNCICGLCGDCVEAIITGQSRGKESGCPRCTSYDSLFKPFQLDI
ncbi:hypothetical protein K470DRAFT_260449, partial [Piedraia hortae CBS 480.64]